MDLQISDRSGLDGKGDDLFSDNSLDKIRLRSPELYRVLEKMEIETVCVVRVGMNTDTDGYLICAEPRNRRIWQEAECWCSILFPG